MTKNNLNSIVSLPLLDWYDKFGRKNLPWQHPRNAYRVWISEIMLQQTQVKTVIPYFLRFMENFPTIWHLQAASDDHVLSLWSGLGYYSRARNIHKTAAIICNQYQGEFPNELEQLITLPGIGQSTAAAIASQAFNLPTAILDGNVKRVLCRHFMIDGWPAQSTTNKSLWQLANDCMPKTRCADYTQAIMDLGATCCTRSNPNCTDCPLKKTCKAYLNQTISLYPFKKPKKTLPIRHQIFLLLYNDKNEIYLEKKPPTGIWGGLWCLPSIDTEDDIEEFIQNTFHLKVENVNELIKFKHTFSHFHLYISALSIAIQPDYYQLAENTAWFHPMNFQHIGMAKPVSKIIDYFLGIQENSLNNCKYHD